jgi:hypothetical protein
MSPECNLPESATRSPLDAGSWTIWVAFALVGWFVVQSYRAAFLFLRAGENWVTFPEDDYFYYLKVAHEIASGHGSTFNGIVATNGYHPLWEATLAAVSRIAGTWHGSDHADAVFLATAIWLASLLTFALCYRLLRPRTASPLLATALALYIAIYSAHLYWGGMEVILSLPLLFAVALAFQRRELWQPRLLPAFFFGLLLSALVLSRLDTVIFLALLAVGVGISPQLRPQIHARQLLGVALGLLPVTAYLAWNHASFGTWLPVSGMAKQLKTTYALAPQPWQSLFGKTHKALLNLAPIFLGTLLWPFVRKAMDAPARILSASLLLFPWLYLFVLSLRSDWKLWDWYFYGLRTAVFAAFVVLLAWQPVGKPMVRAALTVLVVAAVCAQLVGLGHSNGGGRAMQEIDTRVLAFAASHPGVYAMGDRAGLLGYELPDPLVQTEGLVMDRGFLELVRRQTPLEQALQRYNVRYYIATSPDLVGGCYQVAEPAQAGPSSPHMRARFCQPPLAQWRNSEGNDTMIFGLHP